MIKQLGYIILVCLSISFSGFAQKDSLATVFLGQKEKAVLQQEQKDLNFQKFFFKALQQKAIGNFDKAITALEKCKNINDSDKAVYFELSKNYVELEKYEEAEAYIKKGLEKDTENLFMLQLLKEIYNKQSNFKEALEIQKIISERKPHSQLDLVILYIKNNQVDNARQLLIDLEKKGMLSANLLPFKKSLLEGTVLSPVGNAASKPVEEQTIEELKFTYKSNKSFNVLKQLLLKLSAKKHFLALERYSNEAIELFPAQPLVYLMNAKALNQKKEYRNALEVLQMGLDYIVDDILLEANFYEQMSLSYKGMSQNIKASKFYNKAITLRQKKS
jgi:tetratricopeptide (TPR) repeat protein